MAGVKHQEAQQRFIQLRVQGWSYERIMNELNVSKGTLVETVHNWFSFPRHDWVRFTLRIPTYETVHKPKTMPDDS